MKRQAIFSSHVGKRFRSGLVALLASIGALASLAKEPTTEPLLRLETGMHSAPIIRVATDAAGRWAVTASHDKTARIWDLQSGQQVGVLRPPQDTGNEGKLYGRGNLSGWYHGGSWGMDGLRLGPASDLLIRLCSRREARKNEEPKFEGQTAVMRC